MTGGIEPSAGSDRPEDWGWDHHRESQREAWSKATPEQLLAWLEDALVFAHAAGALPRPSPTGPGR